MVTRSDIIQYLNNCNKIITSKIIASHFDVSQRTILKYIKEISLDFPGHLLSNNKGITILKQLKQDIYEETPLTFKDRESYILRRLLMNDTSLNIEQLANELCISEITLLNEIKRIRRHVLDHHLSMKTKQGELFIKGSNEDKKALMIHSIYGEAKNSMVNLSTLSDIFLDYHIEDIREIIIKELNANKFFMDEYSLINLLLHILISMDQNISNQSMPTMSNEILELNRHFVHMIDSICSSIESLYPVKFTNDSKYQFILLLMTRAIRNKEINHNDVAKMSVSKEIDELVDLIIHHVHKIYDIDLNANNFKLAFSLHLKNMLIRLREHISLHNPLLYSIKTTSPFIYDIAVYISNIIKESQNVMMYEDEIAYIALHIGARIEELNSLHSKLKTALVCPQYYSYQNAQFKKIEAIFKDDILMDLIITSPTDLDSDSYDLVLSTIPLQNIKHYVFISNFFNDMDRSHIHTMILNIKKEKERSSLNSMLHVLFDKEYYHSNMNYGSRQEAITRMSEKLIQHHIVSNDFTEKLFERELISPTNFGMIAIPHPIDCFAHRTVISVSLLAKPIPWGNTMVKIVFMFPISEHDFSRFSDVFSFLANLCNNLNNIEILSNSANYEEFLNCLIEMYEGM